MNTNKYEQPEMIINLKEVIWDLLEQWKAVLITALALMVIVTGTKYFIDTNAYENALKRSSEIEESGISTDDRIENVLKTLPEEERNMVEYVVTQSKWIEEEKEYMSKSILMNTNPTNQRTLLLDYYISMSDAAESKMTALLYGYAGYLNNDKLIVSVGKAIDPNAETKFIAELIGINEDKRGTGTSSVKTSNLAIDSDADGAVIEIQIALPDEADADAVERALTDALNDYTPELKSKIGNHSINLIKASEAYIYNSVAVYNHNSIMNNIYNLYNADKNMQSALSDQQKAAIRAIKQIRKEASSATIGAQKEGEDKAQKNVGTQYVKPGISKKYALLGFVVGTMAYAFAYLLMVIIRGRVNYASDASTYTQSRLLGEIYKTSECKGVCKFLNSRLINKYRYGCKMDSDAQIEKTSNSLVAACEHAKMQSATVVNMTGNENTDILDKIQKKAKSSGLTLNETAVDSDINERSLLAIDNVLLLLSKESKVSDVIKITELCRDYDKDILGSIFLGEV